MNNIAIIPARSGSKGLPNKNITDFMGKPLLAHSIKQALDSKKFDTVMVSTDSEEYATIARIYGAEVPFLRSQENSSDKASSWNVIKEVLAFYENKKKFDSFCLLQPTSPLRRAEDIVNAYDLFYKKEAVSVLSVCELEHPIKWCNVLPPDLSLKDFISDRDRKCRRQDYKTYYRVNGAIYIANILEFISNENLYREGCYAYVMPLYRSVDIDSVFDLKFAEFLYKQDIQE